MLSDGSKAQFRNCFIAESVKWITKKANIEIKWNFFISLHGKRPVDALSRTVKCQVAAEGMQCWRIIKDSFSFYEFAIATCQSIKVYFIFNISVTTIIFVNFLNKFITMKV